MSVTKEYILNAKKIQLVGEDEVSIKCGSAEIIMKKNGDINIKGGKINVKGSGDVIVKGSKVLQKLTMRAAHDKVLKMPVAMPATAAQGLAMGMGWYIGNDAEGRPQVTLSDAPDAEPRIARCLSGFAGWPALDASHKAAPVLLALASAEQAPLILGLVRDTAPAAVARATTLVDALLAPQAATLDGKRLVLEASHQIMLKCGKGSITLEASGRVVVKGTELVSRATGANKIRGATVSIN